MNNKDLNNNQIDYRSNDVYAGGLTLLDAINLDLSYNDLDY